MQITDEQYREIAMAIRTAGGLNKNAEENLLAESRAAMEQVAPILREQHYREALVLTEYDCNSELEDVVASWDWNRQPSWNTVDYIKQQIRDGVCIWASRRLHKLTVKPDPRRKILLRWVSEADLDDVLAELDAGEGK